MRVAAETCAPGSLKGALLLRSAYRYRSYAQRRSFVASWRRLAPSSSPLFEHNSCLSFGARLGRVGFGIARDWRSWRSTPQAEGGETAALRRSAVPSARRLDPSPHHTPASSPGAQAARLARWAHKKRSTTTSRSTPRSSAPSPSSSSSPFPHLVPEHPVSGRTQHARPCAPCQS